MEEGDEYALIFFKASTKYFPGHKALNQMSPISGLCYILEGKLVSVTVLRYHEQFLRSNLHFSRGQGWAISLLIKHKPGILFVCPDVFLFGFLHCLRSSHKFRLCGWTEEWQFMKSEDACCLAQKHSQMNLGERKCRTAWPQQPISGALALLKTFWKSEQEEIVSIISFSELSGCNGIRCKES